MINELKCIVCGCKESETPKFYKSKMLCNKHYLQLRKRGKILDKTRLSPNDIEYFDTYAEIILRNTYGEEVERTQIDFEDIDNIKQYKWYLTKDGYAQTKTKNISMKLHRFIMDSQNNYIIDHINRNRLDNRKCNLRYVTITQNNINKNKQSNNTSGYTGISWDKEKNKWMAYINISGKTKFLGYFSDINEAVKIRQEAEQKYYKEYNPIERRIVNE
jgi:hypothetical protein